jgi:hypothetical protein
MSKVIICLHLHSTRPICPFPQFWNVPLTWAKMSFWLHWIFFIRKVCSFLPVEWRYNMAECVLNSKVALPWLELEDSLCETKCNPLSISKAIYINIQYMKGGPNLAVVWEENLNGLRYISTSHNMHWHNRSKYILSIGFMWTYASIISTSWTALNKTSMPMVDVSKSTMYVEMAEVARPNIIFIITSRSGGLTNMSLEMLWSFFFILEISK